MFTDQNRNKKAYKLANTFMYYYKTYTNLQGQTECKYKNTI